MPLRGPKKTSTRSSAFHEDQEENRQWGPTLPKAGSNLKRSPFLREHKLDRLDFKPAERKRDHETSRE